MLSFHDRHLTAAARGFFRRYRSAVEKAAAVLGICAATLTILTFFFRAWANLRRGRRYQRYDKEIRERGEHELERLRQEIDRER